MNAEQISAYVRTIFDNAGVRSAPPDEVRDALVESAHIAGATAADTLYLLLIDIDEPDQQTFDNIIDASLGAVNTLLAVMFTESGQSDHSDFAKAKQCAAEGFFARLGALAPINAGGLA